MLADVIHSGRVAQQGLRPRASAEDNLAGQAVRLRGASSATSRGKECDFAGQAVRPRRGGQVKWARRVVRRSAFSTARPPSITAVAVRRPRGTSQPSDVVAQKTPYRWMLSSNGSPAT